VRKPWRNAVCVLAVLLCEPDSGIAVNSKLYEPSGGWLATLERGIHKKNVS